MELFAGVGARPVIKPNMLLPPTQDLSSSAEYTIYQHARDQTVIPLLERANITILYIRTDFVGN